MHVRELEKGMFTLLYTFTLLTSEQGQRNKHFVCALQMHSRVWEKCFDVESVVLASVCSVKMPEVQHSKDSKVVNHSETMKYIYIL